MGTAAGFIEGRQPSGDTAEIGTQFDQLADLRERDLTATRVGGQPEPSVGFVEDVLDKLKLICAQAFEVCGSTGRGGAHQQIQCVLGGVSEAELERGDAISPVEPGGETADGADRAAGLRGDRAKRTAALEAKVSDEGGEVGWSFTGLTLPKARAHALGKVEG